MGKWIALFVLIITSSILGYLYFELENVKSETILVVPKANTRSLRVFHSFDSGEHRYTGEIKLAHSCYELRADAAVVPDQKDQSKYIIKLTSIDRMLDRRLCVQIPTRYPFDVLISNAPEKITSTLVVDGKEMPIRLIETAWQNPLGRTITPPDKKI